MGNALNYMQEIVTDVWAIHLPGNYGSYLVGSADKALLQVVYNLVDFVNKIAFVLACWSAAKSESEGKGEALLG